MGAGKILLGLILLIVGLWAIVPAAYQGLGLWVELFEVIKGVVPITLVVLGILLMWVEAEELKFKKPKRKK